MNIGSQSTATLKDFSAVDMPCAIPTHTIHTMATDDWKAYTFRKSATSLYSLMTEAIEKTALATTLQDNIYTLQECFLERLYALFLREGIDTSQKISLSLTKDRALCLRNEHSDTPRINRLLGDSSELALLFEEMAIQALALSQITSLQELAYHYLTSQEEGLPSTPMYFVNIKKDMSHFFFAEHK